MVWLVTAQLWAAFSVQLPVFEMQAPIQKMRNDRCRKTLRGLPMDERDEVLRPSGIKDFYHFNDGVSTASLKVWTQSHPCSSGRSKHALIGSHSFCRPAIQMHQRPMQI